MQGVPDGLFQFFEQVLAPGGCGYFLEMQQKPKLETFVGPGAIDFLALGQAYRFVEIVEFVLVENGPDAVVFLVAVLDLANNFVDEGLRGLALAFDRNFDVEAVGGFEFLLECIQVVWLGFRAFGRNQKGYFDEPFFVCFDNWRRSAKRLFLCDLFCGEFFHVNPSSTELRRISR